MSAPPPPADLARRKPLVVELPAGSLLHRFHHAAYAPLFFDRSRAGRLNAPDGGYGVLYAAAGSAGAFAETFLREPGRTLLPPDLLRGRAYAVFTARDPMRLIGLSGRGLARLGATAEVVHGGLPYDLPQQWSGALRGAFPWAEGIAYRARHDDDEVCYAIFERDPASLPLLRRERELDAEWFWDLAEAYGVGLTPSA